jgi:hypothetical protein
LSKDTASDFDKEGPMLLPKHMTEEQLREWGRAELERRDQDIATNLDGAIRRASGRRVKVKLSPTQATWAVHQAQIERSAERDRPKADQATGLQPGRLAAF